MRKCFFALVWTALTMQAATISALPTISVTTATGQAFWGPAVFFPRGSVSADLAGSSFTLNFSAPYPQQPTLAGYFDVAPGEIFGSVSNETGQWNLASSTDDIPQTPGGTVVVNGASIGVRYGEGLSVQTLASTIVPSDVATVSLPAVLTGDVQVCTGGGTQACTLGPNDGSPVIVANVDFDVPGSLTVSFTPSSIGPLPENVFYSVTFTPAPAPEPSNLLTVPAALLLIGLLGRARSVSCAARRWGLMLKYVLLIGLVIGAGRASMLATAQCGSTIVTGDAFANCNILMSEAQASVSGLSPLSTGGGVFADAIGPGTSASATFDDEYVLTVTGGVGNGLFVPCMTAGADISGGQNAGAGASASFGSVEVSSPLQHEISNCMTPTLQFLPFTFGVPQTFELRASAFALATSLNSNGEGFAGFDGILFFDTTAMNPLTGVDFTLLPVPEPATWLAPAALLLIGLLGRARSVSCAARRSS